MKIYSMLFKPKRKVSLAVLTYDNKVLIVKRSLHEKHHPGMWGFPGGGIDEGETAFKAVIRECEEEIGVRPIRVKKLAQDERITWFSGMLPCDPLECIVLNWEHDDWSLVGVDDIGDYDMIDGMGEIIVKVLSGEEDEIK